MGHRNSHNPFQGQNTQDPKIKNGSFGGLWKKFWESTGKAKVHRLGIKVENLNFRAFRKQNLAPGMFTATLTYFSDPISAARTLKSVRSVQ
jgi:hypothetical protein